ncbi:hypothetical protein phiPsal1_054 [Pontimonas phage phiPsal1]|nr:hypothetical protein phiPsal1_054 [Pontimonas phage phiPsal1]
MNNEHVLTRLAQHRERMAEAGLGALQSARFDRTKNDIITREIQTYWQDMTQYFDQEHDG